MTGRTVVEDGRVTMPAEVWVAELAQVLHLEVGLPPQDARVFARRAISRICRRAGWRVPVTGADLVDEVSYHCATEGTRG